MDGRASGQKRHQIPERTAHITAETRERNEKKMDESKERQGRNVCCFVRLLREEGRKEGRRGNRKG